MKESVIRAALAGLLASALIFVFSEGCERYADIRDEQDEVLIDPTPTIEAGVIPVVDSGLESDAFMTCSDRPIGDCVGTNDFLCGFEKWMRATAEKCQLDTGCKTNGWLEVKMANSGCVTEIRMDQPNDEMIACVLAEFGAVRCPCSEVEGSYYFGKMNSGMCGAP
jgi:hypothetical protein